MTRTIASAFLALTTAVVLGGCGRQGDLDRPGPLWGAKAKADWAAAHRPAPATNAPASNGIPPLPEDEDNAAPGGPSTP